MERKHLYKAASETVDKLRARKREEQCGLRKEKRDQILSLKRLKYEGSDESGDTLNLTVEDAFSLAKTIRKHGPDTFSVLRKLKRGFTLGNAIADTFIAQDGALQSLVRYLTGNDTDIQTEAAWCLTNLAGSTQDHAVAILKASGAYLITYLRGSNVLLQDLCACTLANLAGDCDECRRMMMDQGAVDPLVHLLKSASSNVVQSAAFAIRNLAQSNDKRTYEELKKSAIGTILFKLLKNSSTSAEVITELAWILTYFSASAESLEYLFSCGITVGFVVELFARCFELPDSTPVTTAIIRTLGNMCGGPDELGEEALRSGFLLRSMKSLLSFSSHHVRKESLWLLSNLTAGSCLSVKAVLEAGLLSTVVKMLDEDLDIRKESAIVLLNIGYKSEDYLREILKLDALGKVMQLLKYQDNELAFLALQFCDMMLRTFPEGREIFEKAEGVAALEALQYGRNDQICQCVNDLMGRYFENELGEH